MTLATHQRPAPEQAILPSTEEGEVPHEHDVPTGQLADATRNSSLSPQTLQDIFPDGWELRRMLPAAFEPGAAETEAVSDSGIARQSETTDPTSHVNSAGQYQGAWESFGLARPGLRQALARVAHREELAAPLAGSADVSHTEATPIGTGAEADARAMIQALHAIEDRRNSPEAAFAAAATPQARLGAALQDRRERLRVRDSHDS